MDAVQMKNTILAALAMLINFIRNKLVGNYFVEVS